ncbi:hypothetical protein J9317_18540 [Metabacillus sp. KIGAM252]|uniref:Uncharacterized protein n=1 Tax=Metabacillus flavus TaxID=2823519 RepID=A0ABS5LJG4_9BACI|nr:hypothetical protein [Metabacillus flavus]MBS2970746.1 hypothetical protein [Metabacillus flavus]
MKKTARQQELNGKLQHLAASTLIKEVKEGMSVKLVQCQTVSAKAKGSVSFQHSSSY